MSAEIHALDAVPSVKLTNSQTQAAELSSVPDIAYAIRNRAKGETACLRTKHPNIDRSYYELGVLDAIAAKRNGLAGIRDFHEQREDSHYFLGQAEAIEGSLKERRKELKKKVAVWTEEDMARNRSVVQSEVAGLPMHMRTTVYANYKDIGLEEETGRDRLRRTRKEVWQTVGGYGLVDVATAGLGLTAVVANEVFGPIPDNRLSQVITGATAAVTYIPYGISALRDGFQAVKTTRETGTSPNVFATKALRWAQRHTDNRGLQTTVGVIGAQVPNVVLEVAHAAVLPGPVAAASGLAAGAMVVAAENVGVTAGLERHRIWMRRGGRRDGAAEK